MKTLDEIVADARLNKILDLSEARLAIVAFDVLISQLHLEQQPVQLQEWMAAAITPPDKYVGEANSPYNPEAVEWYRAMHGVQPPVDPIDWKAVAQGIEERGAVLPDCFGEGTACDMCPTCTVKEECDA